MRRRTDPGTTRAAENGAASRAGALLWDVYRRLLHRHGPQHWWPGDGPFEVMVGAVLVQNTTWRGAAQAIANLKAAGALSPGALRAMPLDELAALIKPSGTLHAKARKLRALAVFLARYADDPGALRARDRVALRAELLAVHGIGPETADAIMLYAVGLPTFVVDAFTRRIVDRLGLVPERRSYAGYQALFEGTLPADVTLFNEYHALLVAHGRRTCRARAPRCADCALRAVCAAGQAQHNPPAPFLKEGGG